MALGALLAALLLAGCGGTPRPSTQTVEGDGFSFQAPLAWRLGHGNASRGPVDLVEVLRFRLERAYRPALSVGAARELATDVGRLAVSLGGRLVSRSTVKIAGARTPTYRLVYGRGRTLQIAFVLKGDTEFELLCRRRSDVRDGSCGELFSTFALG